MAANPYMSDIEEKRKMLKMLANLFAHGFVIGFTILMLVLALYMFGGSYVFEIHSKWFHLNYETFCLVVFYVLALLKLMTFFFFGIPWLAIRLLLIERPKLN